MIQFGQCCLHPSLDTCCWPENVCVCVRFSVTYSPFAFSHLFVRSPETINMTSERSVMQPCRTANYNLDVRVHPSKPDLSNPSNLNPQ